MLDNTHARDRTAAPVGVAAITQLDEIELPVSLGDIVFARVRAAIIDKSLPPGARIGEGALAEQLGVSRTPVRETLWRLRQMGLVEAVGRKGYQVTYPSRQAIEHAYELREALEVFSAGAGTERASEAELARILEAAKASLAGAKKGDLAEFRRYDEEFHDLLCRCSRNPRLRMYIEDTWALVLTLRERDYLYNEASIACGGDHVQIAEAMVLRDREEVERLVRNHIRQVRDFVLRPDPSGVDGVAAAGA
jgi:DNA-binding GntR family transcriptional regulator